MDEKEGRCDEREREGSMKKSKIVHNMEKGKEIGNDLRYHIYSYKRNTAITGNDKEPGLYGGAGQVCILLRGCQ